MNLNRPLLTVIASFILMSVPSIVADSISIFKRQPQNILTEPSVNITLYCILNDPTKQAIWCQNGFCTLGKTRSLPAYPRYSIVGDPRKGEHNLFIRNIEEADMGTYQCQVPKTSPLSSGHQSRLAYVNLIRPARTISIHKPLQIHENELTSVTCLAEYSFPASRIKWDPERFIKRHSFNVSYSSYPINRTYWSTESTIQFKADKLWQGKNLDCWVIHEGGKHGITSRKLVSTLIQFPTLPSVHIMSSASKSGLTLAVTQGQILNLTCVNKAGGSHDITEEFRWYKKVNETQRIFSSNSTISIKVKRHLQDAEFTCEIQNVAGSKNTTVKMNVLYGPSFFMDKDHLQPWAGIRMHLLKPNEVIEAFGCYVDSNPRAFIRWLHGNQIVSQSNLLVRPDLITSVGQVQEYQCVAIISGLGTFTRTLRLIKDGSPVIRPISQDVVDIGSTARLVCAVQILPKFNELFWTNSASNRFISVDHVSSIQDEKYKIEESWTDEEMYSILFIKSVTESDVGLYNCCALNEHGMSSASVWLLIYESSYLNPLWSAIVGIMIITSILSIAVIILSMVRRSKKTIKVKTNHEGKNDGQRNCDEESDSDLRAISSNGTVGPLDVDGTSTTQRGTIDWMTVPQSTASCWYGLPPFAVDLGEAHQLNPLECAFGRNSRQIESTIVDPCEGMDSLDDQQYRQQSTV